jgi:hypothetical protein
MNARGSVRGGQDQERLVATSAHSQFENAEGVA